VNHLTHNLIKLKQQPQRWVYGNLPTKIIH